MDESSKLIHKAAGLIDAAGIVGLRADQFRKGTARGRATAQAMDTVADELRNVATNLRQQADDLRRK